MKTRVWIQDWRTGFYRRRLELKVRWDRDDGQPEVYGNVLSVHFAVWRKRPSVLSVDIETRSEANARRWNDSYLPALVASFGAEDSVRFLNEAAPLSPEAYAELRRLISSDEVKIENKLAAGSALDEGE